MQSKHLRHTFVVAVVVVLFCLFWIQGSVAVDVLGLWWVWVTDDTKHSKKKRTEEAS